jgi:integrase
MNFVHPIRNAAKIEAIETFLLARNRRDWLLFVTGTNSGLRISDLLALRVRDTRGPHLVVKEKKTGKRKFIKVTPYLRRAFNECTAGLAGHVFLFRSRNGGNRPICRARAYQILREAALHAGLEHIGTHTMRKTFGYHLYRQTKDVALLQSMLSHSDPAVTLRYIGIDQDLQDRALSRFKWQE